MPAQPQSPQRHGNTRFRALSGGHYGRARLSGRQEALLEPEGRADRRPVGLINGSINKDKEELKSVRLERLPPCIWKPLSNSEQTHAVKPMCPKYGGWRKLSFGAPQNAARHLSIPRR